MGPGFQKPREENTPSKSVRLEMQYENPAEKLSRLLNGTKDSIIEIKKEELAILLNSLLSSRTIEEAKYLLPKAVLTFYEGYQGTINVDFSHIEKILPSFKKPDEDQLNNAVATASAYGTMPGNERATLVEMVRALKPRTILEIGTHLGLLSNDMISVCPKDTFLITLDLPKERWAEARFNYDNVQADYIDQPRKKLDFPHPGSALTTDLRLRKRIAQIEADSGSFDFSPFYGKMDVVVVDGNHTATAAVHDLNEAMKLVSPGGIIFIDDANKPFRLEGVSLAIYLQTYLQGKTFYWANWQNGPQGNLAFYVNTPEATNKQNIDPKLQGLILDYLGLFGFK